MKKSYQPPSLRLSHQRLKVLARFLEAPTTGLSGADLMRETGLASGSLYPILIVFERAGLLEATWETEDPRVLGRPRRRLYRLTTAGTEIARRAALELQPFLRLSGSLVTR